MTLISSTILDRIASLHDLSQPDHPLDQLDELLSQTFKLNRGDSTHWLWFGLRSLLFFEEREGLYALQERNQICIRKWVRMLGR